MQRLGIDAALAGEHPIGAGHPSCQMHARSQFTVLMSSIGEVPCSLSTWSWTGS